MVMPGGYDCVGDDIVSMMVMLDGSDDGTDGDEDNNKDNDDMCEY